TSEGNERDAPVEGGGDGSAEGDAQRRADRRTEIVNAECLAAPAGREVVGDERIGGRDAARLADADQHPRHDELRIAYRQAAAGGRNAPDRAGDGQYVDSVGLVGNPTDRNGDEAVEEREIEPADEA